MKFALCGMGYVAKKHLQAIKDVGGEVIAILDPNDSVGFIDSYFPNADYFDEEIDFWEYIKGEVDYVVICSPNYCHFHQIQWAKSIGAKVICEKPLVLTMDDLESLNTIDGDVSTILQLRLHPEIKKLKITDGHHVVINYSTPRGKWYFKSWKGDKSKSGGLLMNIGVHLFDLMFHLFGDLKKIKGFTLLENEAAGIFEFDKATVEWRLALFGEMSRKMLIDGKEINFTNIDLHTESYKEILAGRGFKDVTKSIGLVNGLYSLIEHCRADCEDWQRN
jgi:UDP-N-acetyl-2-amino-2-deoxyglucuronate dehydrogenase